MKRKLIALAAVLTTALAALAGCSSGRDASGDKDQGGAKGQGGQAELRVALGSAIGTLSVFQEAGIANYHLAALAQEGLLALNSDGQLEGALAESWQTEDQITWVFKLRPDVKFHDGAAVTAEDVLFSLEIARDPTIAPGLSTYWPEGVVVSQEATAADEITIVLDGPHSDFAAQVSAAGALLVVPKAFWEQAQDFGSPTDLLVGTGPYRVTEFDPASHVSFEKFKDYWGPNDGPDKVRVDFITDDATRLLAFQEGEVDAALTVPIDQADQWTGAADATVTYVSDRSYQGLTFDQGVAPFEDLHVRRAIAHAIDKEGIVQGILAGHGQVATGIDSPVQLAPWGGSAAAEAAVTALPTLEFDLTKAGAELAQSTQPNGFSTTLTYPTGYPAVGRASLAIAESLAEIGIELEVKEIPLEQWLNEVGDGEQGVAWMIYHPTTPIPNEISSWLLAADGPGANPANWTDPEVATVTAGLGSLDDAAAQLAAVVQTTSAALEQVVYAPVYWGESAIATRPGVTAKDFGPYTLATNWAQAFAVS
ncbi:MAG: ABC transporter substrate-binding protein [Bifidobacteriaceae bacterium]|jgi:peptide/nickel transport system substrate-binding protein|nr:ABC transporter substrate-binding protein [Bifidobacteriaceae bacterium]